MKEYLLLLPLIYIFHDFEEMIGFGWFFRRNRWVFTKYPRLTAAYRDYNDAGMAVGVFEQLAVFFGGLTMLGYCFPCRVLYGAWYGMLIGLTGHFAVHIGICAYIRRYVPSLITAVICLPVGAVMLVKTGALLTFDRVTIISAAAVLPLMMLNLRLTHRWMFAAGRKLMG